jgi:hypothetical protein
MNQLRYTLLSDGPSDRALLPILTWLLLQLKVSLPIQPQWADVGRLRRPPRRLPEKIEASIDLFPCELLFVHRDAETMPRDERAEEIRQALREARLPSHPPAVCVVPVRMTEAWLLFDEPALRRAAGNPNGRGTLPLPRRQDVESLPDPKKLLADIQAAAVGDRPRRRALAPVAEYTRRVADFTSDFSPLRALPAFSVLVEETMTVVREHGWDQATNDT